MSQGLLDYSHVSQPLSKFTCSNTKAPLSHYELIFEMMNLHAELHRLVQLRRSSALIDDYQGRWASLKVRASEFLDIVSLKCIKIQEAANLHRIKSVHLIEEDPAPLLLAYTPFYHKLEYITREGRMVKQVREEAQKDKVAAKAREDLLLQKQLELELEATLKRQEALIARLMNQQPQP